MENPEFSNDVNKHLKEDFINDFSSAIETAETKLVGNICELKYDIAELKQSTDNVMVGEIEFLMVELTPKNNTIESLLLL